MDTVFYFTKGHFLATADKHVATNEFGLRFSRNEPVKGLTIKDFTLRLVN